MCPGVSPGRPACRCRAASSAVGIEGAPGRFGDRPGRRSASVRARRRRSPSASSRSAAASAGSRRSATGSGRARPSCSRTTASTPGASSVDQHRFEDGADERRHVAADDEDDRFAGGAKAGREAGQRAFEGDRVVDDADAGRDGRARHRVRRPRGSRSRPGSTPSMALVRSGRPSTARPACRARSGSIGRRRGPGP